MADIKSAQNIIEEALYIKEKRLDYNLIKIFSKDRRGQDRERKRLAALRRELKDDFYVELIYVLTHEILDHDSKKAKELFKKIVKHKRALSEKLGRNVGVEVASLDYLKNIEPVLSAPEFLEENR